jgi:hypothetical protein
VACNNQIFEGAEAGDLNRLVQPMMSIDEFKSKMGEDKDIVVIGFTIMGKEPADDLTNFIEKSYDWVLDADISSGETSDGNYMVFVEVERKQEVPDYLFALMEDMMHLTDQKLEDWKFSYLKDPETYPLTIEELTKHIITSPEEYEVANSDSLEEGRQLNSFRALAGVKVNPSVIKDMQILSIQRAAGIK